MDRVYNFNAGPAAIPVEVLQKAQGELLNFNHTGMSVMELSHRSQAYDEVHNNAKSLLKELLNIPDSYDVLFLQGGASLQFAMIPMNFLNNENIAYYILSGAWSEKALSEAKNLVKQMCWHQAKSQITHTSQNNSRQIRSKMLRICILRQTTQFLGRNGMSSQARMHR